MKKILLLLLLMPVLNSHATPVKKNKDADLETIRNRITDDLLEPSVSEAEIKKLITTIQPDGTWPGINYKDVSRTGFEHRIHLENMVNLSRAYKKPGNAFYKDPKALKALSSALDFWLAHDFICDNWWWNEMGTPNLMINTLLLIGDNITEQQRTAALKIAHRANLENSGSRPGGDLIVIAGMLGKQALLTENPDTLQRVINVMIAEIKVTTGRGLKPDMSFHHRVDNVISTLTYGTNYISAFAYWAVKTAGTKYALPKESLKLLTDYYLDGICASMAYGKYPDPGAKNRDLSRRGTLEPWGPELPENLLQSSSYRANELQDIIDIRKGKKNCELHAEHSFWHSEYFTHQRPTYFTSARMFSSRNYNMEQPHNEEGLKNHHFSDGANFLTITGKEYVDVFPVWDWHKVPGTTVVQKSTIPHWNQLAKKGLTDFVGGVTDGEYGAAAFDMICPHDLLKARKSWFFFDKEYVCLGSGINATDAEPVATTLNQCLLNGAITAKTASGTQQVKKGSNALSNVSWVLHNNVAYLFPSPTAVHIDDSTATGNWRQITHQAWATEEPVQKDLFCLYIDHGAKPVNASYAYIVVPNADVATADRESRKSSIAILSNTPELQAVQHKELHISQAVFYKAGEIKLSPGLTLSVNNPCMVMVKTDGATVKKLTVSDPTHKLSSLQVTINGKPVTIDLPKEGYAGKSVSQ